MCFPLPALPPASPSPCQRFPLPALLWCAWNLRLYANHDVHMGVGVTANDASADLLSLWWKPAANTRFNHQEQESAFPRGCFPCCCSRSPFLVTRVRHGGTASGVHSSHVHSLRVPQR